MTINKTNTTGIDDKNDLIFNANEPNKKVLEEKLRYHKMKYQFHLEQADEIIKILKFLGHQPTFYPDSIAGGFKKELVSEIDIDNMKKKSFWNKKAIPIIQEAGILLQTSDILKSVNQKFNESDRRYIVSIISSVLSDLCDSNQLKKHKIEGKKGYYYGSLEMFDGNNPIVEF